MSVPMEPVSDVTQLRLSTQRPQQVPLRTGTRFGHLSLQRRLRVSSPQMTDPLSLVPLALAARGGRIDQFEAAQLVAAGVTLLQRSAALVRALAMGRSAIVLPPSPAVLLAMAASDGRGALVLDPDAPASTLHAQLSHGNARAVFTMRALVDPLGAERPLVLLDEAPMRATVLAGGREFVIDLGSHFGLALEGEQDSPGRDEECVVMYRGDGLSTDVVSHRQLLAAARARLRPPLPELAHESDVGIASVATLDGLLTLLSPLLAGEAVRTTPSR